MKEVFGQIEPTNTIRYKAYAVGERALNYNYWKIAMARKAL